MARQISVSDEVYEMLSEEKGEQSFSELLKKIMGSKGRKKGDIRNLERFFGMLKNKDIKPWIKEVNEGRKRFGRSRLG